MIRKYRRRDHTVAAVRWLGEENCEEVFAFLGLDHPDDELDHGSIHFDTPTGGIDTIFPGDWAVANDRGAGHHAYDDTWFRAVFEPEPDDTDLPQPLLFWDEAAGVTHQDGRITIPVSKGLNLAQTAPAGKLILPVQEALRLRSALNGVLFDAYETADEDIDPPHPPHDSWLVEIGPEPVGHTGGNAEDCPACQDRGFDMLIYPWICPGKDPDRLRCAGVIARKPHAPHDWQWKNDTPVVTCPGYTESVQ